MRRRGESEKPPRELSDREKLFRLACLAQAASQTIDFHSTKVEDAESKQLLALGQISLTLGYLLITQVGEDLTPNWDVDGGREKAVKSYQKIIRGMERSVKHLTTEA